MAGQTTRIPIAGTGLGEADASNLERFPGFASLEFRKQVKMILSRVVTLMGLMLLSAQAQNVRGDANASGQGGGRVEGGNVVADVSIGETTGGGVSVVSSAGVQVKGGYTGQLYDPVLILPSAAPSSLIEGSSAQLSARAEMDDGSTVVRAPVGWKVLSGPIPSVSVSGLATAGAVFQNTPALIEGTWFGAAVQLTLNVIDSIPDNFGSYAGDGIDDTWQVGYFGEENPEAAPGEDPDHDGQDNLLEFLALVDPTDPASRFLVRIRPSPGPSGGHDIVFGPIATIRTYTVLYAPDLAESTWVALPDSSGTDSGTERTVTDDTLMPRRFYKIQIAR